MYICIPQPSLTSYFGLLSWCYHLHQRCIRSGTVCPVWLGHDLSRTCYGTMWIYRMRRLSTGWPPQLPLPRSPIPLEFWVLVPSVHIKPVLPSLICPHRVWLVLVAFIQEANQSIHHPHHHLIALFLRLPIPVDSLVNFPRLRLAGLLVTQVSIVLRSPKVGAVWDMIYLCFCFSRPA